MDPIVTGKTHMARGATAWPGGVLITPPPIGERSIVMSVFVCPRAHLQNCTSDLYQIFTHVTYGRGSVRLWRRTDTLCTSGFMDYAIYICP